jgi:hypothetical protein
MEPNVNVRPGIPDFFRKWLIYGGQYEPEKALVAELNDLRLQVRRESVNARETPVKDR